MPLLLALSVPQMALASSATEAAAAAIPGTSWKHTAISEPDRMAVGPGVECGGGSVEEWRSDHGDALTVVTWICPQAQDTAVLFWHWARKDYVGATRVDLRDPVHAVAFWPSAGSSDPVAVAVARGRTMVVTVASRGSRNRAVHARLAQAVARSQTAALHGERWSAPTQVFDPARLASFGLTVWIVFVLPWMALRDRIRWRRFATRSNDPSWINVDGVGSVAVKKPSWKRHTVQARGTLRSGATTIVSLGALALICFAAGLFVLALVWQAFALTESPVYPDAVVDPRYLIPSTNGAVYAIQSVMAGQRLDTLAQFSALLGVLSLAGAAVLQRFAVRLRQLDGRTVLARDDRQPIVYLRAFADDRVTLTSRRRWRETWAERLSPFGRQRFEEVLGRSLRERGPTVAVTDPRRRMAPLGIPRVAMPADWQPPVAALVDQARLVVISGTPGRSRGGFRSELELLDERPGTPVLIVLGPHSPKAVVARWARFLETAAGLERFHECAGLCPPDGAIALLIREGHPTMAWGARRRRELSYRRALSGAIDALEGEHGGPSGGPRDQRPTFLPSR
ncbi:MAG: hypothetical protein J7513_04435 [Solirubrobacteraceae bacterium]|nr:hypothetical protein [Solirubrobacteraceae bacterium]